MAEGRTDHGIADQFQITPSGVEKHVASIFAELGLPPAESAHRRVLAVVLRGAPGRAVTRSAACVARPGDRAPCRRRPPAPGLDRIAAALSCGNRYRAPSDAPHQDRRDHRPGITRVQRCCARLVEAGMDVARLNFSHGRTEGARQRHSGSATPPGAQRAPFRRPAGPAGTKLHIGRLAEDIMELHRQRGSHLREQQGTGSTATRRGCDQLGRARRSGREGEIMYLADGAVRLRVTTARPGDGEIDARRGGGASRRARASTSRARSPSSLRPRGGPHHGRPVSGSAWTSSPPGPPPEDVTFRASTRGCR